MKKKIFYIGVFILFLIILFLSPISGDDWGNYKFNGLSYAQEVAKKWCKCGGDLDAYDKIHENEEHIRESKKYHREHRKN